MAKLTDDTLEACAEQIANAVTDEKGREYLHYETAKLCTQAAVYMRALELVDGVDFEEVNDYVLTSEGPKDGDLPN